MEGSPAEEEREHHGSWWTFLSFYIAYILYLFHQIVWGELHSNWSWLFCRIGLKLKEIHFQTEKEKSVNIESWNCSGGCCLTWVKGKERKELVRLQEIREVSQEPRQQTSKYTAAHKIHTETFALFPLNCWLDLRVVPIGDHVPLHQWYKDIHSLS